MTAGSRDTLSPERRSWNMSRIRSRDTRPEVQVRSLIHQLGFRFRLHRRDLPGTPDIVLARHRVAVFVHGCFWHRHHGCRNCTTPTHRRAFWLAKFRANVERDLRTRGALRKAGWRSIVIWECEVEGAGALTRLGRRLSREIPGRARSR